MVNMLIQCSRVREIVDKRYITGDLRMIVGLTGTLGAGKDSVAEMLLEHGFTYHSLSDIIRDQMKREGKSLSHLIP